MSDYICVSESVIDLEKLSYDQLIRLFGELEYALSSIEQRIANLYSDSEVSDE